MELSKKASYCVGVIILMCTFSCGRPNDLEETPINSPVFSITDSNWSDTLVFAPALFNSSSFLNVGMALSASSEVAPNLIHAFDTLSVELSPAEQFAIEKIRSRSQKLYEANFSERFNYRSIYDTPNTHLANIYVRRSPMIVADKRLFGKDAGEDLSSLFLFYTSESLITCQGPEYSVVGRPDPTNPRVYLQTTPSGSHALEYFTEGVMLPLSFCLVATDYLGLSSEEGNDINLKFVLPVTIEHYWSWLLELYDNPEAEKSFTDTELVYEVNLRDLM